MFYYHYDLSSESPYGNHVTTFPYSPHYNLKASTIAHFIVSKYVFKCECFLCVLLCVSKNNAIIFLDFVSINGRLFMYIYCFLRFLFKERNRRKMSFYIFFTLFSLPRTIRRNQFNSNTHKHNIENAILWTKILSKKHMWSCVSIFVCKCSYYL